MSSDLFEVPGPLPAELRHALGFPDHLPVFATASHADPLGIVVRADHLDGSRSWAVVWDGGGWIGLESPMGEFEVRKRDGVPPESIAGWVNARWAEFASGGESA